jgi:SAM-dependent MidA family methyltransferase
MAAARALQRGKLMTIDYGRVNEAVPESFQGTLRAYKNHRVTADLLAHPGEQDLTAHVNFSRIRAAGEAAGLQTEAVVTQEAFLTNIATRLWRELGPAHAWGARQIRQFQTLTHPEHLGRRFRVLLQERSSGGGLESS